ncbi:hypothetical protein Zmor_026225 [Zophobas morio]|uniref:Uncharacterized protein n=1 Tax=Zophobas morio TaxID=2755281 RepID=A0AA38HTJ4_9CUCU|nr:hypothetical protein Zmor_026225 [Zophobas morio]
MTASLSFQVYTGCTFKNHLLPHPSIDPGVRPLEKKRSTPSSRTAPSLVSLHRGGGRGACDQVELQSGPQRSAGAFRSTHNRSPTLAARRRPRPYAVSRALFRSITSRNDDTL